MGLWDAPFSPSALSHASLDTIDIEKACTFSDLSGPSASRFKPNFCHFQRSLDSQPWAIILLESCQKSSHLHCSAISKSSSIFKLRSGFCHRHMMSTEVVDHGNLINWYENQINQSKSSDFTQRAASFPGSSRLSTWRRVQRRPWHTVN